MIKSDMNGKLRYVGFPLHSLLSLNKEQLIDIMKQIELNNKKIIEELNNNKKRNTELYFKIKNYITENK